MTVTTALTLVGLIEARGVELRDEGQLLQGRCPLHENATDIIIGTERKTWSCSACSVTDGNLVTWVMVSEGVSEAHATELLRVGAVGAVEPKKRGQQRGVVAKQSTIVRLPSPFSVDDDEHVVMAKVVDFYADTLKTNEAAVRYLHSRGLRRHEIVERFRLGYANRTLGLRLPGINRVAGRKLRGTAKAIGLLRESGHEHLYGCLVVPIFDDAGNVVQLYGRKTERQSREDLELHLWTRPDRRGVFNLAAFKSTTEVIVTASIVDALTCWNFGMENVTAPSRARWAHRRSHRRHEEVRHEKDRPRVQTIARRPRSGREDRTHDRQYRR